MKNVLQHKRNRSQHSLSQQNKVKLSNVTFKREYECSSRTITFIDVNGENIEIFIQSKHELEAKIKEFNFSRPYFIDEKGREILINNIDNFFHLYAYNIIYNMKEYINIINETKFNEQYKCFPNDLKEESLYLDKFFFENKNYYKNHTKNYEYICFNMYDLNLIDIRSICCTSEKSRKIVEIFIKNKVGITTYLHVFFSQLRTRIRTIERFIPFIIFDYDKLLNLTKIKSLVDTINFSIVNLFVTYKEYNYFCSIIYKLITELNFDIDKIIISIIKSYMEYIKKYNMEYVPCIILDNYNPNYKQLYNALEALLKDFNFRIIFIYLLDNKLSNEVLVDYLREKKNEMHVYKYAKSLYYDINKLPTKYPKYYKCLLPTINNYIKINNCKNEEEAKNILIDEENYIEKEILKFYIDNINLMNLYINEISILIDKEINLNNDYERNIILNTPLNVFDIEIYDNYYIKIKYSGENVKNVVNKICCLSIIDLLPNLTNINMDNFIKDGILKRGVKELLIKKLPIFGKIEEVIDFNCILNYFKNNKDYRFNEEELKDKYKRLKILKELKIKYKTFIFSNKVMITQSQNGKDWHMGIIEKDVNDVNLCLIQVSVNKTIEQIQNILKYFDKKVIFIKRKIKEILNINIKSIHVLFIFLRQTQNLNTIVFCKKYNIPYIYYDLDTKNFIFENVEKIVSLKLNNITSYMNNCTKWEESLNYGKKDNTFNELGNEIDEEFEEEEEIKDMDNFEILDEKKFERIIANKNPPLFD